MRSQRAAAVLALLFVSGATGLAHEIAWIRLLRLVVGNTTHAATTVVCAFMAGLALGSAVGGRLADRVRRPLLLFALLEAAVAAYALALPALVAATGPFYGALYRAFLEGGDAGFATLSLVRLLFGGALLLLPSACMGATLPLVVQVLAGEGRDAGAWLGRAYAANSFGAVAGALLASFVALPGVGLRATIALASAVGLAVALGAAGLARWAGRGAIPAGGGGAPESPLPAGPAGPASEGATSSADVRLVVGAYALAGAGAMACEIAWSRALTLLVGSTTYAFGLLLAGFVFGLSLGSAVAARFVGTLRRPWLALVFVELAAAAAVLATGPLLGRASLVVTGVLVRAGTSFWRVQLVELGLVLTVLVVPTALMGAALPIAGRLTVGPRAVGRGVGGLYASNTLGSIVGAFAGGFLLVPTLGIQGTLEAGAAALATVAALVLARTQSLDPRGRALRLGSIALATVAAIAAIPPWDAQRATFAPYARLEHLPPEVARSPRALDELARRGEIVFHSEGVDTTVSVRREPSGELVLLVDGKPDASTVGDLPTQLLLAHLPLLLHQAPRDVLVIGLASGITLGAVAAHPVEAIDCAEISSAVVRAARVFEDANHHVLDDTRVRVLHVDGRNHLALSEERYDVILSQPSNPWIAGVADLFTREFFELCRSRLRPGGVACVWLARYHVDRRSFESVVRTFVDVFPTTTIWSPMEADYLLVGATDELAVDCTELERRFGRPAVRADLAAIGIDSTAELLATLLTGPAGALALGDAAPLHTDDDARLEFATPRRMFRYDDWELLELIERRREPDLAFLRDSGDPSGTRLAALCTDVERRVTARGHAVRADAYLARGKRIQFVAELRAAAELAPEEPLVRLHLRGMLDEARARAAAGDPGAARQLVGVVLEIAPDDARAHALLAELDGEG